MNEARKRKLKIPTYSETVREEAARRGISIRAVRRERNQKRVEGLRP